MNISDWQSHFATDRQPTEAELTAFAQDQERALRMSKQSPIGVGQRKLRAKRKRERQNKKARRR